MKDGHLFAKHVVKWRNNMQYPEYKFNPKFKQTLRLMTFFNRLNKKGANGF